MSIPHLLLIALGPVQDFIAQARRSRDLWFGSHLLSELSRAAAQALVGAGATLIFPAFEADDRELAPCNGPTRHDGTPPVAVANKLLADIPAQADPRKLAEVARTATRARWRGIANGVRNGRGQNVLAKGVTLVWDEQIEDMLEFYAAWYPCASADKYPEARKAVEQALGGRKNLRDFAPWVHDRTGAPKSSLDGARVSVLADDRTAPEFRRLRISEGENLDAIGLVKRAGFEPEQFVPLVNVAAGAWLARAAAEVPEPLDHARQACKMGNIPRVNRNLPVVDPFPFDASVLYPSRWPSLAKDLAPSPQPLSSPRAADPQASDWQAWGEANIRPLLKAMRKSPGGEPPAYVACLVADGDRMGQVINTFKRIEDHQSFSRALAEFPRRARDIVEHDHLGSLIYAGGDDVLAFLPVAHAPTCAEALSRCFRKCLDPAFPEGITSTLSVGIGIGHVLEAMSWLLDLGRQAERVAKQAGRNHLAILFDKRSGGQRRLVMPWDDTDPPSQRLSADAALLSGPLSIGKLHELEALLRRFPQPGQFQDGEQPKAARALAAYAAGLLAHTESGARPVSLQEIGLAAEAFGPDGEPSLTQLREAIAAAIDRLLVVHTLRGVGFSPNPGAAAT